MQPKSILVPYDGSSHALNALKAAVEIARDIPDAHVHVVSIVVSSSFPAAIQMLNKEKYQAYVDTMVAQAKESETKAAGPYVAELGDRATVDVAVGATAAEGIMECAKRDGADLIVMGRRGLGALRGMIGSVSTAVLRSAETPVLTVL